MKYVPGPMFGQLSGSQGNTTAAHNPWGSYVRNRTTPVNPATAAQTAQRVVLQQLSQAWRALTAGQRSGWSSLGGSMQRTDSLGQTYELSGLQAFTSINRVRRTMGEADVDDAPALDTAPTPGAITLSAAEGTPSIALAFTGTFASGEGSFVDMSSAVSAGINFQPRSAYKLIQAIDSGGTTPFALLAAWQAVYGSDAPAAGTKLFLRMRGVSINRIVGAPVLVSSIVLA